MKIPFCTAGAHGGRRRFWMVLVLLLPEVVGRADVIVNGGFEGTTSPSVIITLLAGHPTASHISGWRVTRGSIDHLLSPDAADGIRFLDLDGASAGAIAQTLVTQPGGTYLVRFKMGGNPDRSTAGASGSSLVKALRVSAAGASADYRFNVTGLTNYAVWSNCLFAFTAASAVTTLEFASLSIAADCCWGATLDQVSVTPWTPRLVIDRALARLSWESVAGLDCIVEARSDPGNGPWLAVSPRVRGDGSRQCLPLPDGGSGRQRFFRLATLP